MKIIINGIEIVLKESPDVFSPTIGGLLFCKNLPINKNERVIDIGTGSGLIAIVAAKNGARVCATDISTSAVRLAEHNAFINKVDINFQCGSWFSGFEGTFDRIFANLPNEITPPDFKETAEGADFESQNGGPDGCNLLVELLKISPKYMTYDSCIYIMAHSLTDYEYLFSEIHKDYECRILNTVTVPVKSFVTNNWEFYLNLFTSGKIFFSRKDGVWNTLIHILELKLKLR